LDHGILIHFFIFLKGEAGIGKTALVELLSYIMEATFKTKIIHAGVAEQEIIELLNELTLQASQNPSHRYVLFFDEVVLDNFGKD